MTDRSYSKNIESTGAVAFDKLSSVRIFQEVSNLDLNDLLEGWPHEPGQVKARKIVGRDGCEKIQLRIDLGLIQMELNGRPDGVRPHGLGHETPAQNTCDERDLPAVIAPDARIARV